MDTEPVPITITAPAPWVTVTGTLNPDGSIVFRLDDIEVPSAWSQVATDILAQKYFRKAGIPQLDQAGQPIMDAAGKPVLGGERDARPTSCLGVFVVTRCHFRFLLSRSPFLFPAPFQRFSL